MAQAIFHNGIWQGVSGGIVVPPPVPGGVPGGVWGTPPWNGPITSKAGLPVQSGQWSLLNAMADGSRAYGGLANAGDLTTWTSNEENHIQRLGNGADIMFRGGRVLGPMVEWNGTTGAYWEDQGLLDGNHYHGDTGLAITKGLRMTIEFFTAENVGDGISFGKKGLAGLDRAMNGADGSVVRYCLVLRVGDDCIENDWKDAITVYGCFLSGMMLVSTRPGNGETPETTDTSSKVMTINNCLMWRRGKRFRDMTPNGGSLGDKLAFNFFKWQTDGGAGVPDGRYGMQCHLYNSVLRYDGEPTRQGSTTSAWGTLATSGPLQRLTDQANNWLVMPYMSSGYPPGWPVADLPSFTGRYLYGINGQQKWIDSTNAYAALHPELSMTAGDKGINF